MAKQLGVDFAAAPAASTSAARIVPARIGLWDQYGGSMESGWTRWILEQFEFKFDRVFAPQLDAGGLNAKYDVLIFPNGGIPGAGAAGGRGGGRGGAPPAASDIPAEYRDQLGRVSAERTHPAAEAVPRVRGDDRGDRRFRSEPDRTSRAADRRSPRRERQAAAAREVLRSRLDPRRARRHVTADRGRDVRADELLLRQQPGVQAQSGGRSGRRTSNCVVRQPNAAQKRMGLGPAVPGQRRRGDRGACREGAGAAIRSEILQRAQPHGTFKLLFNALTGVHDEGSDGFTTRVHDEGSRREGSRRGGFTRGFSAVVNLRLELPS